MGVCECVSGSFEFHCNVVIISHHFVISWIKETAQLYSDTAMISLEELECISENFQSFTLFCFNCLKHG